MTQTPSAEPNTGCCKTARWKSIESVAENRIGQLRKSTPLPTLLRKLGLRKHARPSCTSPLREDSKPSWGIYQRKDRWFWKDHGNGDGGDEIEFLARLDNLTSREDFTSILDRWEMISKMPEPKGSCLSQVVPKRKRQKPDCSLARVGTPEELAQLCQLRGFDLEAMEWAQQRGTLRFGNVFDYDCYGVTDQTGKLLEWRHLDGQMFPALGELPERKSHTAAGSQKSWPVGLMEAQHADGLLLVEGLPDLLAAHCIIWREGKQDTWAPVGMLGATARLEEEAAKLFLDKRVLVVPHLDDAGIKGAQQREAILKPVTKQIGHFLVDEPARKNRLKDLCDYLPTHKLELAQGKAVLS